MLSPTASLLFIPLLFASLSSAITWDCTHVRADGVKFNFEKLKGPHSVSVIDEDRPPSVYNNTWTVDICEALVRRDDINKTDQCPQGTFVCGIISSYKKEDDSDKHEDFKVVEAIPIAGNFQTSDGKGLEPQFERLKKKDAKTEGLELELNGGTYDKRKQKAIIQLQCDKDKTGNEGKAESSSLARRADEKDDKNSLSFVSYGGEEGKEGMDILRLNWKTQYACEDAAEEGSSKGGWGFFTWLILLLFLGIAAYLIFGSWLNYNRYGARGWDLLPHGDTIRDIPYLFKDWSRRVVSTVSGGGSRGGYSAV